MLTTACRLVAGVLGTSRAKVLELRDDGTRMFARAGIGWNGDVIGHLNLPMSENSSESYSIRTKAPVVTRNIRQEDRFDFPDFMKCEGVVSLANAPNFLPGGTVYGLLQVDGTEPCGFTEDDSHFLRTYCAILGQVVDRLIKENALRTSEERFRMTLEAATNYAIFITDAEGRITDWLPGAEAVFGWSAQEAKGLPSAIIFTPKDLAAGRPEYEIETARRTGYASDVREHLCKDRPELDDEFRIRRAHDGAWLWHHTRSRLVHDNSGRITEWLGTSTDVQSLKELQERQQILVGELQHRTRNLIGVIGSIASQTMASTGPT